MRDGKVNLIGPLPGAAGTALSLSLRPPPGPPRDESLSPARAEAGRPGGQSIQARRASFPSPKAESTRELQALCPRDVSRW